MTKSVGDIARILETYDLTRCAFSAAKLAGCDPKTVQKYVDRRNAGMAPGEAVRRMRMIDSFLPKIEELVDHSRGNIRADVVHQRLVAMGFTGTDRTTRRAVAEVKAAWNAGCRHRYRPWVPEPGLWLQVDWGKGPKIAGRFTHLFCAWLSWSRFRVVVPAWDRTLGTMVTCLDASLRRIGGVPAYVLTGSPRAVTSDRAAGVEIRHPQLVAAGAHYGCTIAACEPFDPQARGGMAAMAKISQADMVPTTAHLLSEYGSFAELAAACGEWCEQVNARPHGPGKTSPIQQLAVEQHHLHPVPAVAYRAVVGHDRVLGDDWSVSSAAGRYPAPPGSARMQVFTATPEAGQMDNATHRLSATGSRPIVDVHDRLRMDVAAGVHPPNGMLLWSHDKGAPLERLLCARLSVFADGFGLSAAQAVCSGGPLSPAEIPGLLDSLVDKAIAWRTATGASGLVRYGIHEAARAHGEQYLKDIDETRATRRRHRDFHRELVHRADAAWMGPDQVYWSQRMASEHANLRTALDFSLADGDGHSAVEMGGALWFFWFACGRTREGRRYLERALDLCREPDPRRAKALWACGITALQQGDSKEGARLGSELRRVALDCGSRDLLSAAAYLEGSSLRFRGAPSRAAEVLDAAPGSPSGDGKCEEAWFLVRLARALVHAHLGESRPALAVAEDLRTQCAARGDQWMNGWANYTRAQATLALGRPNEAAALARSAVGATAQLNDTLGCAVALDVKATAVASAGRGQRAAKLLGISQRYWQSLGLPQLGMPTLVAARAATELRIRQHIGDTAYGAEYRAGLETETDAGIAYCLAGAN